MNVENPWVSKLIALFFALVLFSFVAFENESRNLSTDPTDGASITSSEVVTNLPIDIIVNRDTYFVSGIPETATIRLEGPQAILTQTLATQNFTIKTPNLDELGPGQHTIALEVEGLSNQLEYSIMPSEVLLEIEEKRVKDYEVRVEFNENAHLEEGYTSESPILSSETVTVSGALSTMEEISDVMVVVMPEEGNITEDIEMTLNVLVLDDMGDPLNVNITPQTIDVTIPVKGIQKTVPIVLEESGTLNKDYEYTLENAQGEPENVTITGESDIIEELKNYSVEVDLSGVTESTIRTIPLNATEGINKIEPETLDVLIRVNKVDADDAVNDNES
ncbi:CdaR family protein [Alkalibacterium kapii]|uniref:CdaA regulatory protein CdaR n=1 Tax=Alkalibacterium kapii TaxID=426704 RepID=A0A511ATZ5_9LACT|nr:CdaR family protein [Alkalibacterium kapii]GEK90561.1 hypothetical protein AKA01nite_01830 [Alkalibacterium kapii]